MAVGDGPTVLVVDDDPGILGLLEDALAWEGYRVATAPDGAAGLAAALAAPPDLILTDLAMPGMGGEVLCRRLKADPRTGDVPLLVITALPPTEARARLAGCQHDGLLAKPFDLERLLTTVAAFCPPPAAQH